MFFNLKDKKFYFILGWYALVYAVVLYTAIEAPLSFVFEINVKESHLWWDGLFSFIFLVDVVLHYNQKLDLSEFTKEWYEPEQISKKPYKKSIWLPLDLIASIPFDIIAAMLGLNIGARILGLVRLLRLLRVLKFKGLLSLTHYLPKFSKVALILSAVSVIVHWIACGWMFLNGQQPDGDLITAYNKAIYWTVTTLTTIGYGDITPTTNIARMYTMVIMVIGVGTYGFIIGNFSKMILLADKHKEEKKEKMNELSMFLRHYGIPSSLRRQVFSFFNHILDQSAYKLDQTILTELPAPLQSELQIYIKIQLIKNIPIFSECNLACQKMIAENLEQRYHAPKDMIIKNGEEGSEMFIIAHGDVDVYAGEKIATTLKSGQFFGEIALLEKVTRSADIKAKTYCDLYTLDKENFDIIIKRYPTLKKKFEEVTYKRKSDLVTKKAA